MAVHPVALCADLQPWYGAGLSLLYFPEADNLQALLAPAPRVQNRPPVAFTPGATPAPTNLRDGAAAQSSLRSGAQGTPNPAPQGSPARQNEPVATNESAQQKTQPVGPNKAQKSAFDPAALPQAWRALLPRLKAAPVIWTYAELGEDLLVQGSPERSAALKLMIGGLRLPAGTSAFLPVQVPGVPPEQRVAEAGIFGQLLQHLQGRVLIVLGAEAMALTPFAASNLGCFQEAVFGGRLVLCLPSLSELQRDAARMDATILYLRTALSKINLI